MQPYGFMATLATPFRLIGLCSGSAFTRSRSGFPGTLFCFAFFLLVQGLAESLQVFTARLRSSPFHPLPYACLSSRHFFVRHPPQRA